MQREPVAVVPVTDDANLRRVFRELIARGNPTIPAMRPSEILPKYAGLNSYGAFTRGLSYWTVEDEKGFWQILPWRKAKPRGFVPDPAGKISLPPGTSVDALCDRMIEILQTAAEPDRVNDRLNAGSAQAE